MQYKTAIKSVSFLWMGSLIGSGSTFIIYTILARKIGPESFGLFSSALATITIFSLLAGFGVSKVWLKLFGKEGWGGTRWVKPSLNFVVLTLVLISAVLLLLTLLEIHDNITRKLLLVLIFYIYGYISVELVCSKLQLEERYRELAFWQLSPNLLRLLIIVGCFYILDISLLAIEVGYIYALVGSVFAFLGMYELHKMKKGKFALKGHELIENSLSKTPKIKEVFKEAWPFGLANFFAFIYVQSDIIMVKYIVGDIETGYYNVSYVILASILIIPTILFGKFLMPKYHRWANHNAKKFREIYLLSNKFMMFSGMCIMLIVYFSSDFIIPLIFGEEYLPSISLMKTLSFTLPISFMAYSVGATLVTKSHMKTKVILMGIVALSNIFLNIILIPIYGAKGAAFATILSNFILLVMYYFVAEKKVFFNKNID